MLVAAKSLIAYLWKMILPVNLIPYYPYPKDVSFFSRVFLSAIVLVAGITVACLIIVKKQKLWLSVWGYYVVTLIPGPWYCSGRGPVNGRQIYVSAQSWPISYDGVVMAWGFGKGYQLNRLIPAFRLFGIVTAISILLAWRS